MRIWDFPKKREGTTLVLDKMHLKTWLSYGEINFILYFNTAHIGRVNLNFERLFQKNNEKY